MKVKDKKTGRFVPQPLSERFWEKVKKGEQCWEWQGYIAPNNYGRLRLGLENKMATHVSWFLSKGRWPKLHMCHKCDNRRCVRPSHLFEGTHRDNMADMVRKGRNYRARDKTVILTEKKVREIKKRLKTQTPRQVEQHTGVNYWSIIKIKNNKQWKDVK